MKRKTGSLIFAATRAGLTIALGILCAAPLVKGQVSPPKFEVDPFWPKPLPHRWVTGTIGGVCVDAQDHVFILNRRNLSNNELDAGEQAPPVMEFDPEGNVVNFWGDPDALPGLLHGCFVDRENNLWMAGDEGSIVQKWTHAGDKLLLQLGKKGVFDSSDGTPKGRPLNSSHTLFFSSSGVVTDLKNGDVYVADSNGNHRVAVFDRNGQFVRQWELERTPEEAAALSLNIEISAGLEGFRGQLRQDPTIVRAVLGVQCITMSRDGQVYVCDRAGDRAQVFDKMGNFERAIHIDFEQRSQTPRHLVGGWGTVVAMAFSPDPAQKLMYAVNEDDEQIEIIDRGNGQVLSSFGRVGHQIGEFMHAQCVAVDSKGNIYVGESGYGEPPGSGHRVQKFKIVGGS
jgi:DNA-binding beta-propeller fold protein YncE